MFIFHFALVDSEPGANVFQEQKPRAVCVGLVFSQKWGRGKKALLPRLMWIYRAQPEFTRAAALLPGCCYGLYCNN